MSLDVWALSLVIDAVGTSSFADAPLPCISLRCFDAGMVKAPSSATTTPGSPE